MVQRVDTGESLVTRLDHLRNQMETERVSWWSHWRELADYILPTRPRWFTTDSSRGSRKNTKIYDSTATYAAEALSSAMMGGITSPARPWFRLTVIDPELAENTMVQNWLHEVTKRMQTDFLRGNLYDTLPELYQDLSVFGTSVMYVEEDLGKVSRFYVLPIGSYMLANDEKNRVSVLYREFRMTVRQIVNKFAELDADGNPKWDNISSFVRSQWENKQYETWVEINHFVLPNEEYDPNRLESRYKRWRSVYYERGGYSNQAGGKGTFAAGWGGGDQDKILRDSGFDFFPVLAPRWGKSGEDIYGTDCPGMKALGDIKALQLLHKRKAQALDKQLNPPMNAPMNMKRGNLGILPGHINFQKEGQQKFEPVYQVTPQLNDVRLDILDHQNRITRMFFLDIIMMLLVRDRRERTATEVQELQEERLLQLGRLLERLNEELLNPLIDAQFLLMLQQGRVPPIPNELMGVELKVEYLSVMAQAQKLVALSGIERFVAFVGQVASADPAVLDKWDRDQTVDEYAEITGVPPSIRVPDEQVMQIRQARERLKAAVQATGSAREQAATMKDLSQAKIDPDSALGRLAEQAEAGAVAEVAP